MYIFEVFVKWLGKNKRGYGANPDKIYQGNTKKLSLLENEEDEAINCNHNFMPIDSTGEILACTKCGFVVKKSDNK
jgi:hypothetical protein